MHPTLMKSIIAAFALAGLLAGCNTADTPAQTKPSTSTESASSTNSPVEIARAYIAKARPDWARALRLTPVVLDRGDKWQVTFEPDGAPVIMIDKQTRKVVDAF